MTPVSVDEDEEQGTLEDTEDFKPFCSWETEEEDDEDLVRHSSLQLWVYNRPENKGACALHLGAAPLMWSVDTNAGRKVCHAGPQVVK